MNRLIKKTISSISTVPFDLLISHSGLCKACYLDDSRKILESISPKPDVSICEMNGRKPRHSDGVDLSVIVPFFNVENYIADCLDSVLSQDTSYSFEVVLINDGSIDSSRDIALSYAANDSRIVVIDQDNKGIAAARNTGLTYSAGKIVTFIDSDDFVMPGFIDNAMNALVNSNSDYVSTGYVDVDEYGKVFNKTFSRERMGTVWGRFYKNAVWSDLCFPTGYLFEDTLLPYLIGPRFTHASVHDCSYCYRHRKGSLSRTKYTPKAVDTYWIVEYLLDECMRLNISFDLVMNEFLTNACFTVCARRKQLDSSWFLPLFSAFSDLWNHYGRDIDVNKLSAELNLVSTSLNEHNFRLWKLLGIKNMLEE